MENMKTYKNCRNAMLAALIIFGMLVQFGYADDVDVEDFDGNQLDADDDGLVEDVEEEHSTVRDDLTYESPKYDASKFHFVDHFDNIVESQKNWVKSQAKKDNTADEIAKYDGVWSWEAPQRIVWRKDTALVLKSNAKHAAIASRLWKPFTFKENKPLIVQYEVTMQDGQDCGGSYIKLLSAGKHTKDLTKFNDKTPYTIMFGPDKCGSDVKLHFIFRHVNPINGSIEEKHCRKPKSRLEEPFKDKLPHLYQLVVRPDNTFEIRVDNKVVNEGSLLSEFTPPVNPPREIDDPDDLKPSDWDEREKIPDPTAQKPADWDESAPPQIPDKTAVMPDGWLEDEPEMIPDPAAAKPDDWDAEIDGEWEAPLVDNPVCENVVGCGKWKAPLVPNEDYKGKWHAPLIDNPNYQGKWTPRKIPNVNFFEDLQPFRMTPIDAIGLELWSMSRDLLFDNIIITDDLAAAREFAANSFDLKRKYIDKESNSFFKDIKKYVQKNSWTWKTALVLVVVVISFNIYRLVVKKSKKKESNAKAAAAADAKKTDAPQPDDEETDEIIGDAEQNKQKEEEEASGGEDETAASAVLTQKKQKKSDLNVKEDILAEANNLESQDQNSSGEENAGEIIDDIAATHPSEESTTKTARKRQVRKD